MPRRPIFVAATRQHVGKTSTSLALISGLVRRYGREKVGFIKPVGQQHELVNGIKVDKDARLMKEYFQLACDLKHMSPVVMPSGYTRNFIDGKITEVEQVNFIKKAYERVASMASEVVLLEGSGHTGVGSIVALNNARVASILDADMVLVANGGLGSAFDELDLNRVMCKEYGVRVKGVVINKVMPEKYDMINDYFGRAVKRWGIPLLGVVPDEPYLGKPTLHDFEKLFKTELLAGHSSRKRHYSLNDSILVATGLNRFLNRVESLDINRPLFITHCSRTDVILGFAAHTHKLELVDKTFEGALILSGMPPDHLTPYVVDMIKVYDLPALRVNLETAKIMEKVQKFVSKLNLDDRPRVTRAVSHYEKYIDFDTLLS